MVKLCEDDIIGIGCSDIDPNDSALFAYKVCIVKVEYSKLSNCIASLEYMCRQKFNADRRKIFLAILSYRNGRY